MLKKKHVEELNLFLKARNIPVEDAFSVITFLQRAGKEADKIVSYHNRVEKLLKEFSTECGTGAKDFNFTINLGKGLVIESDKTEIETNVTEEEIKTPAKEKAPVEEVDEEVEVEADPIEEAIEEAIEADIEEVEEDEITDDVEVEGKTEEEIREEISKLRKTGMKKYIEDNCPEMEVDFDNTKMKKIKEDVLTYMTSTKMDLVDEGAEEEVVDDDDYAIEVEADEVEEDELEDEAELEELNDDELDAELDDLLGDEESEEDVEDDDDIFEEKSIEDFTADELNEVSDDLDDIDLDDDDLDLEGEEEEEEEDEAELKAKEVAEVKKLYKKMKKTPKKLLKKLDKRQKVLLGEVLGKNADELAKKTEGKLNSILLKAITK